MSATFEAGASRLQERLGAALETRGGLVATPRDIGELVDTMAIAHDAGLRVLARGLGLRLDWGNPVEAELVVATAGLGRVIEYAPDDLVVTAEAGMTLADLNSLLATRYQVLPLEVAHPERTTLGGLVAAAPSSLARTGYGEVKDWLIGLKVATPDGLLVKGGGKVVKNVAGYDLCKLYAGSLGTLGAIAEVTFRVRPGWEATALVSAHFLADRAPTALAALQATTLMPAVSALEATETAVRFTLGFDGFAETVAWQLQEAVRLLEGLGGQDLVVQSDAPARETRAALARSLHGTTARASVLPSDMPGFLDRVRELPGTRTLSATGLAEHGALWLTADLAAPLMWLEEVRAIARGLGGHVTLEGRGGWPIEADAFMLEEPTRDLMRRIQAGLDPAGRMAPGRFRLEGGSHGAS